MQCDNWPDLRLTTFAGIVEHLVIIGNGIAGITTARHVRKLDGTIRITVVSAESDHFFSRTALMYIYMGHMKYEHTKPYEDWFWEKNRIELKRGFVTKVDAESRTIQFAEGESMSYTKLVLALGSKPNKFGWPGQDLKGVQGLYSLQDLEQMEENTKHVKRAVIVGGGLIGVEMAEMLNSRKIPVTFLVREDRFWASVLPKEEGELVSRHLRKHHVELKTNTELKEILADGRGRVRGVITSGGEEIACEFVGLTAGVSPNIEFIKGGTIATDRGILVNKFLETNVPNVYAAGDCAQMQEPSPGRKNIEQVWYTGRMMGEALARTIVGKRTEYNPGFWFNSAKFFDIEYQTYGSVHATLRDGRSAFYWEDTSGTICLKMVFDQQTRKFKGLNVFGIRLRHVVCERWLQEERTIEHCMQHLKDANFDPEFFKNYESDIIAQFNKDNGTSISPARRSWKRILNLSNG